MTRKGMKRSAEDRKFSLMIRERDGWTCQRCGQSYVPPTQALHCAHMFSRGKLSTRFDPENAKALCYGCHRYLDQRPVVKRDWFEMKLGIERFAALEIRANTTVKRSRPA